MDSIETMVIFQRVAELGSFTQAAENLGLPKATVSAAIRQLEGRLGTRLLHRTTRRVSTTPDGQMFYERSRDLLADLDELQGLFAGGRTKLAGRLRIDLPSRMGRDLIVPRLPEFLAAHPHLEVELSATDRLVDVVREGFDLVLRAGPLTDSSLVARPLGDMHMLSCASPGYLADAGLPQSLADLAQHRLVHYVSVLGSKSAGFEYLDPESGEIRYLSMAGVLTVNNTDAYIAACLAGLGIAQIPAVTAQPHLADGRLVAVLPELCVPPLPITLLYASRRHLPLRVRAFMDWLAAVVRPHLADNGATEPYHHG
jgi:DNA-binding transcriptional LysR family regulator